MKKTTSQPFEPESRSCSPQKNNLSICYKTINNGIDNCMTYSINNSITSNGFNRFVLCLGLMQTADQTCQSAFFLGRKFRSAPYTRADFSTGATLLRI
jgi:hypothetical protein